MNVYKSALLALIFGLLGRAAFLEYTHLVDPTETRYGVIAQEMLLSHNWLTPSLPMPEGIIPYLGKPPLHFWLTALAYKVWGFDEWTSRVPSLLATIGILVTLWLFAEKFFGRDSAFAACLIYLSSGMAFFLAGASVTDVTLTFLTTASVACLYYFQSHLSASRSWAFVAAMLAALSFLTKGPVSLVLIWLPLILFSLCKKDFSWFTRFPWFSAAVVFLMIAAPWFVMSEVRNPGFIKYFFWNENVARYLFREYGDRYGSGHVHMYGTAWAIVMAAFLPWTLIVGFKLWKRGSAEACALLQGNPHFLFTACWAISTPLFFTFVRQLHAMYLLPAIPALSVLAAVLLDSRPELAPSMSPAKPINLSRLFLGLGVVLLVVGALLKPSGISFAISLAIAGAGYVVLKNSLAQGAGDYVRICAIGFFGIYLIAISSFTPFINLMRSTELALEQIALGDRCPGEGTIHHVGINSKNDFSHYWTANAWHNELAAQVKVSYVPLSQVHSSEVCHFLVKEDSSSKVPLEISQDFSYVEQYGEWLVYSRVKESASQGGIVKTTVSHAP